MKRSKPQENQRFWLLRRADQLSVAVAVLLGLVSLSGYWMIRGGLQGRLIEIDRAAPLQADFQVDINSASWPELVQLPGIGEVRAKGIVESRRREGPFRDIEDLRRVKGIGPATLKKIRPYLLPMPGGRAVAER